MALCAACVPKGVAWHSEDRLRSRPYPGVRRRKGAAPRGNAVKMGPDSPLCRAGNVGRSTLAAVGAGAGVAAAVAAALTSASLAPGEIRRAPSSATHAPAYGPKLPGRHHNSSRRSPVDSAQGVPGDEARGPVRSSPDCAPRCAIDCRPLKPVILSSHR